MTFGYIYKIEFPNGKHYIGLTTTSLEKRTNQHKRAAKKGDTQCLYIAIRKYDMVDTFELIEIDTAETREELCEKEFGYILMYNSYYKDENGYNMTFGGDGVNGYICTEDDRQKISELTKKYYQENPNAGNEHGEIMKEYYKNNPEARKKQSEILKKHYKNNPDKIQQISESLKKYFENPEARQKNSDAQKKRSLEWKIKKMDIQGYNKPFDIFTKDGLFIRTFTYQFEAREYLQKEHHITSSIKIGEVLSGQLQTSAGFVFKYK